MKAVSDYLTLKRHFWIRINTQGQYDARLGKYRTSPYTMRGVADLLIIHQGQPVFIELKTAKGRQSPDQILFEKHCDEHAVEYAVVRSVDDIIGLGL